MGNFAQSHDCAQTAESTDCLAQEIPAIVDFRTDRFVAWRNTPYCVGNRTAIQAQPVIGRCAVGAMGKAETGQRFIQQFACMIAGKWPSCPVCSAKSWRQTYNQKSDIAISRRAHPGWHRPVVPVRFQLTVLQHKLP
jgi:hypothetical protein